MAKVGRKPGFKHSEETKAKMAEAHRGRKYNVSPEGKAKLSKLMSERMRNRTLEQIRLMADCQVGRSMPKETRQKISKANKGRVKSAAECKRISDGKRGKCSSALRKACLQNFMSSGSYMGCHKSIKTGRFVSYRSRYELAYILLLDSDEHVEKFDYEPFFIRYQYKGQQCFYLPDFFVKMDNGFLLVEVKPDVFVNDARNKAKFAAARVLCLKKGWRFEVVTENTITSMLISSQADLCVSNMCSKSRSEGSETTKLDQIQIRNLRTSAQHPDNCLDDDIVRYSEETRRVEINNSA